MASGLEALRVLLVDDNKHMRAIITTVLRSLGVHDLRQAHDGAEALETLKTWPADVAFVDFRMSPVDGVEFTQQVRTAPDSRNPYLPIIMITGYAERHRVCEARDAGVTEFVVKPLTARALIERLNAVIYHPRPFVRTRSYFGPCRRRIDDVAYIGPERRTAKLRPAFEL